MTSKQTAVKIIKRLRKNGFQALLAGGCVRDMLLGRRANDYDVATDAKPGQVIKLFRRTIKVGTKFGVVIVLLENRQVEVATFRAETGYTDGRHPSKVKFTNAAEDAVRRDFTVNGMFYDPIEKKVIDYVNGQADLKKRILRTIGSPAERFGEDYLRMLRAVRFSTQLDFPIEPKTWTAVSSNAKKITGISGERICAELEGILVNPNRSAGAAMLSDSGLLEVIFPGFIGQPVKFAIKVLGQLPKKLDYPLALAGLFAGCETKFALGKLKTLKLSRQTTKHVKSLLTNRDKLLNDKMSLAELKTFLTQPYFYDLFDLQKAIQKAKGRSTAALIRLKKRIKQLGDVELHPKPILNGHELMRLGAVPGPALGQLAQEMYIVQLEGQLRTKTQAKEWVRKWLKKHRMIEK